MWDVSIESYGSKDLDSYLKENKEANILNIDIKAGAKMYWEYGGAKKKSEYFKMVQAK